MNLLAPSTFPKGTSPSKTLSVAPTPAQMAAFLLHDKKPDNVDKKVIMNALILYSVPRPHSHMQSGGGTGKLIPGSRPI